MSLKTNFKKCQEQAKTGKQGLCNISLRNQKLLKTCPDPHFFAQFECK